MDRKYLAETVSRRDAAAEPHGWAKFNQHGACLSEVLPVFYLKSKLSDQSKALLCSVAD
jgi:hypothetical protein